MGDRVRLSVGLSKADEWKEVIMILSIIALLGCALAGLWHGFTGNAHAALVSLACFVASVMLGKHAEHR